MAYGFDIALSALNATSNAINVTANNLANLNTTGFKASQVSFEDLFAQSLGVVNQNQSGFGVATAAVTQQFSQGSLQDTGGQYDAAIQGDGFFVIQDPNQGQLLTRDGSFTTDSNGNLVTATGQYVQGWTSTAGTGVVDTNGPIGNIQIPTGSLRSPVATQNFEINMNLNAAAPITGTGSTFSTPIQVTDSLGETQTLTATFTNSGGNSWAYSISIPASALSATSTTTNPVASGTLTFDSSGNLTSPAATPPSILNQVPITINGLSDGAANMSMNWNLSDPTTGVSQISQISEPSAVSTSTQDGVEGATLIKVGVGTNGSLVAQYSDGQTLNVGQIALATVRNPESLSQIGDNNYQLSAASATPVIGTPGTGGRGTIVGGDLESSTVDIATEFTNLIVYQRSYEAAAKVVTSEDQLSQDTIAIKQQ
jgi:flagellar hook protein FlgE